MFNCSLEGEYAKNGERQYLQIVYLKYFRTDKRQKSTSLVCAIFKDEKKSPPLDTSVKALNNIHKEELK